jgi:hypothetical protein
MHILLTWSPGQADFYPDSHCLRAICYAAAVRTNLVLLFLTGFGIDVQNHCLPLCHQIDSRCEPKVHHYLGLVGFEVP